MSLIISRKQPRFVFIDCTRSESDPPLILIPRISNIQKITYEQWKKVYFSQLVEMMDTFYNALSIEALNKGHIMVGCQSLVYAELADYIYRHSSNATKAYNRIHV